MNAFKFPPWALLAGSALHLAAATSTVDPVDKYAWGADLGWINCRDAAGATLGAVFRNTFCSGYLWSANCGWVNLGDGLPVNGVAYSNGPGLNKFRPVDFGVNHVGSGALRGLAWSPNLGWLSFEATGDPRVDLTSGALSGLVWSANAGWINLEGVVTQNAAPVVVDETAQRIQGTTEVRVKIAKLLGNDHDPEGNQLSLTAVGSPTPTGAVVTIEGDEVVYTAPPGLLSDDQFTYTVRGGIGLLAVATGTVEILVRNDDISGRNIVSVIGHADGSVTVSLIGLPETSYRIQATDSLVAPVIWSDLQVLTADARGQISYLDADAPNHPTRYYRTLSP